MVEKTIDGQHCFCVRFLPNDPYAMKELGEHLTEYKHIDYGNPLNPILSYAGLRIQAGQYICIGANSIMVMDPSQVEHPSDSTKDIIESLKGKSLDGLYLYDDKPNGFLYYIKSGYLARARNDDNEWTLVFKLLKIENRSD